MQAEKSRLIFIMILQERKSFTPCYVSSNQITNLSKETDLLLAGMNRNYIVQDLFKSFMVVWTVMYRLRQSISRLEGLKLTYSRRNQTELICDLDHPSARMGSAGLIIDLL